MGSVLQKESGRHSGTSVRVGEHCTICGTTHSRPTHAWSTFNFLPKTPPRSGALSPIGVCIEAMLPCNPTRCSRCPLSAWSQYVCHALSFISKDDQSLGWTKTLFIKAKKDRKFTFLILKVARNSSSPTTNKPMFLRRKLFLRAST